MKRLVIVMAMTAIIGTCACESEPFFRGIVAGLLVLIYDEMQ
jgi:hypothetical protein